MIEETLDSLGRPITGFSGTTACNSSIQEDDLNDKSRPLTRTLDDDDFDGLDLTASNSKFEVDFEND